MTGFNSSEVLWSFAVILIVPLIVIGAAELEERLRQSESAMRTPVLTFRNWVLPFFAAWALLVPVLGTTDEWFAKVVATGLLTSLAATVWQILRVIGDRSRSRPPEPGRRQVPALVLLLPRLALLIGTGVVVLAGVWDVDLSSALAALGVTSLVVSFALQDTLSGLASGVLLLSDRPFTQGDWISADEVEGEVIDINWRTSRIRNRNGDVVVVPNSVLANASVVNHSSPEPLHRVAVTLQVAFANPPTLAKDMLLDAARSVPGVLTDPMPTVMVTTIDDPLMGYDVHMWVSDFAIVPRVKSDFGALVWYQSRRHNVPLPSPAQDVFLHDPIAEARSAEPTLADLRDAVRTSPLLADLPDVDLDRLAQTSHRARFRAGELMVKSGTETRDLLLIVDGSGRLVLLEPGFDEAIVTDVGVGDIVGLLETERGDDRVVALRAFTDCEVIVLRADAVDEIGSRNVEIVAAFNRLVALRRRRINRLVERRGPSPSPAGADRT